MKAVTMSPSYPLDEDADASFNPSQRSRFSSDSSTKKNNKNSFKKPPKNKRQSPKNSPNKHSSNRFSSKGNSSKTSSSKRHTPKKHSKGSSSKAQSPREQSPREQSANKYSSEKSSSKKYISTRSLPNKKSSKRHAPKNSSPQYNSSNIRQAHQVSKSSHKKQAPQASQAHPSPPAQSVSPHVNVKPPLQKTPTNIPTYYSPHHGRLDHILRELLQCSHKHARTLITTGKIKVNHNVQQRWETTVNLQDQITIHMNAPNPNKQESLGAQIIYQDQALVVLNKPAGLLSAPSPQSDELNALIAANRLCKGPRRPRVVHRLDKETSGLLLFARTIPAARQIQEEIKAKKIRRIYRCIVKGVLKEEGGYISSGLVRDAGQGRRGSSVGSFRRNSLTHVPREREVKGKWALTRYQVVQRGEFCTALEVELLTGKTHQIRIHLAELGFPILGEWVYAYQRKEAPRLALHATRLIFMHPFKQEEINLEIAWPYDLRGLQPIPDHWLST